MPKLQLIYFEVRARAETPRMILHFGKIPYSEETCATYFQKSWPEVGYEQFRDAADYLRQTGVINSAHLLLLVRTHLESINPRP
jgi:hypothetical protein